MWSFDMDLNNNIDAKIKECLLSFYKYKMRKACECYFVPPQFIAYTDKYKYLYNVENEIIERCRKNARDIVVENLFEMNSGDDFWHNNNAFANRLGINHRDEIFNFAKTCCQNNSFVPKSINKFINEHENIFDDSNGPDKYELMFKHDERKLIKT